MANKGNGRHVKAINAPRYLGIHRKGVAYVAKPSPGRHTGDMSMPLMMFLKKEGFASTTKEAERIIKERELEVNGKVIIDPKYPIGISDVIHIKKEGAHYNTSIDKNSKAIFEKNSKKTDSLVLKVVRKYIYKQNKLFISFHDGSIAPCNDNVKVNDSVVLGFNRKINKVLALKKGANCFVFAGVHVGTRGTIMDIIDGNMHMPKVAIVTGADGEEFKTMVENIMVVE